jgi:chromate reductase
MARKIGLIIGSLRKAGFTRMLGTAVMQLAPASMTIHEVGIGDLPLYNLDLETDSPPAQWTTFREGVKKADGVLFLTPEFNRGIPGALKNAIDVGSRPWGHSVWNGKPTAVMSITPGPLGAMAAHQQLRHTLSVINSPTLPGPEVYMHSAATLFDDAGKLKNDDTKKIIETVLSGFDTWIGRFK